MVHTETSALHEHIPTLSKEKVPVLNLQVPRMKMESDARRTKAGGNDGGNEDRSRNGIEDRKRPCLVLIDPSSLR